MRFCSQCGHELPDAAAFCGYCGAKVPVEEHRQDVESGGGTQQQPAAHRQPSAHAANRQEQAFGPSPGKKPSRPKIILWLVGVAAVAVLCILLFQGLPKSRIIGTWHKEGNQFGVTTVEFTRDGIIVLYAWGVSETHHYKLDGDSLIIYTPPWEEDNNTDRDRIRQKITFEFDGDTLILTGNSGPTTFYKDK